MFPASCRGRALELCLLTASLVSACASTGPGTTPVPGAQPSAIPGVQPSAIPGVQPSVETRPDTVLRRIRRPVPKSRVDSASLELAVTKRLAHRPLALALEKRIRNPELADRVASAVVYEAGRARIAPSLLAAVLLIENAPFDTTAVSAEGAIGLMQVMPVHVGSYRCLSGDLLNVEANICHGARLLHAYLRRTKSVDLALRRYNGCVRGRNTPRCHRYPTRVLRTASRLRHEILVSAAKLPDRSPEDAAISSSQLGAGLPKEPEDTTPTTGATSEPNLCSTLVGCLRHKWSLNR
jgi:transglycosylase-like protein with SLT domain